MNRLTGDFKGASMFATVEQARQYNRLRQYEDTGLTPDEIADLRDENDRLCAALKLAQTRAADIETEVEAGRLVRLPAAIGQLVFVPVEDGGMYAPYVNGIAFLRPDAHDAVMEAVTTVGIDRERLTFMIARENKGTHWFETEEEARAALEGGQHE